MLEKQMKKLITKFIKQQILEHHFGPQYHVSPAYLIHIKLFDEMVNVRTVTITDYIDKQGLIQQSYMVELSKPNHLGKFFVFDYSKDVEVELDLA
jgi:hypothetical protein